MGVSMALTGTVSKNSNQLWDQFSWLRYCACQKIFFHQKCSGFWIQFAFVPSFIEHVTYWKGVMKTSAWRRPWKSHWSTLTVNVDQWKTSVWSTSTMKTSLSLSLSLTNDILAERAWAWVVWDSLGFVGLFLNFTYVIMRGPNKL